MRWVGKIVKITLYNIPNNIFPVCLSMYLVCYGFLYYTGRMRFIPFTQLLNKSTIVVAPNTIRFVSSK